MKTEKQFIDEMLEKGLLKFKSKRQLAFAIGLGNAQALSHWLKRDKVPGDWKPAVCALLDIEWHNLKVVDLLQETVFYGESFDYEAIDFALLGIFEYTKSYPKTMSDPEWRKMAFKTLYKAWFNEEMRRLGAVPLLSLIA